MEAANAPIIRRTAVPWREFWHISIAVTKKNMVSPAFTALCAVINLLENFAVVHIEIPEFTSSIQSRRSNLADLIDEETRGEVQYPIFLDSFCLSEFAK
jgi:hypothetical protein